MHHMSHGTLGIAYSLVRIGHATGRPDLVDLGLAGVADVVARDEGGPDGFLVRHSTPQFLPDLIEPVSYGWCHGPAGDAHMFRLLRDTQGDPAWAALADRCWHTVVHSGLPQRLRPGFWDNNGRCCGTAGVLALAGDRLAEGAGGVRLRADPRRRPRRPRGAGHRGCPLVQRRATRYPAPAGRRAARASCVNCCASSG